MFLQAEFQIFSDLSSKPLPRSSEQYVLVIVAQCQYSGIKICLSYIFVNRHSI